MAFTTEFLASLGLSEDQSAKVFAEHGKSLKLIQDKVTGLTDQLNTANGQIQALSDTVKGAEGKDTVIADLQGKVKAFEDAEKQRQQAQIEADRIKGLRARFDPLKGEKKYLNEGTENWVFADFQKALADPANTGKSDAEIYATITKDKNLYENPQQVFKNPPQGRKAYTEDDEYYRNKYKNNPFIGK